ncbi:hypothetical protein FACS1894120_1480 [Clostridia bacterium]|nr:hypothetical protein FACS1894120_1480 [Clostridia bacterium]
MVDVIGKIIDIDKNAKNEVSGAKAQARSILEDAAQRKADMKREYDERIRNRIEIVNLTFTKMADEEIIKAEKRHDERILKLDKAMEANRIHWQQDILDGILRG